MLKNDSNSNVDALSPAKQEEWTTSRKVVNHKTKQVETRVQRQIVMEDGKVIADSGPLVTSKTKEDQKQEETENTNHKNIGDVDVPRGYKALPGASVVTEKTETHNSMREAKEENMHYHDESLRELSGLEIHKKALQAPNQLITIDSENQPIIPKGKLVHYSSKSNRINDTEEVKETSRLGRDGNITTETTRTQHHEEFDDDEVPDKDNTDNALPESTAETTRKIEYLKDYDEGFDNFPNAMHNRNPKIRAIDVDRSPQTRDIHISREQEIGTTRWLDDHFGSDESDIVETSDTRAGKKVVNVEIPVRGSTPASARSSTYHSIERSNQALKDLKSSTQSKPRHTSPQKYTSTATYYVKDSRSPSPRSSPNYSEYYISRPIRETQYKEDASVQASLSDEEDTGVKDIRSTSYTMSSDHRQKQRVIDKQSDITSSKPDKTFYFGDDKFYRRNGKNTSQEYLNQKNTQQISSNISKSVHNIERETNVKDSYQSSAKWKDDDYLSSNVQTKVLSSYNDKLNRNVSPLTTTTDPQQYWGSPKSKQVEYIHHPIIETDLYGSSRRSPSSRQRSYETSLSPPPQFSSSRYDTSYADSRDYKYNFSSSPTVPSPPSSPSGGTWTKSKARQLSPVYRSTTPDFDFPEFSPLTSPLEIKNVTDSFSNGKSYFSK